MKSVNLFTSNLEGRARIMEVSATNKATRAALANFAASIDAEFTKVIKDTDRRARNVANAAKGKYKTAAAVVAACYPYQTAAGELLTTKKDALRVRRSGEYGATVPDCYKIVDGVLLRNGTDAKWTSLGKLYQAYKQIKNIAK